MNQTQVSRLWHQLLRFHGGDRDPEDLEFLAGTQSKGTWDGKTMEQYPSKHSVRNSEEKFKVRQNTEAGGRKAAGCAQMVEGGRQMCKEDRRGRPRT